MPLRPFNKGDIDQLIAWIDSSSLNYQWGGPTYQFPLTKRQIVRHIKRQEVTPFLYERDDQRVGVAELFFVEEGHYRICRVFVSDSHRGQGVAKQMLKALIIHAATTLMVRKLSLVVFAHNHPAIRCYQSLDFETVAFEQGARKHDGASWDLIKMELIL